MHCLSVSHCLSVGLSVYLCLWLNDCLDTEVQILTIVYLREMDMQAVTEPGTQLVGQRLSRQLS